MRSIDKILDQYVLTETTPITLIRESTDNEVYKIGNLDPKILRISKRLIDDIQFEYEVFDYFQTNGFPIPQWIKTTEGNTYASFEEMKTAVMFNYLPGYQVEVSKGLVLKNLHIIAAGKTLGRLATLGQSFSPRSPRKRNIFTELNRALENREIFIQKFEDGDLFIKQIEDVINFGKITDTPWGLIHNDFRASNIIFENDEVRGVIDFDWSCIGPQIKDLALAMLEWSFPDGADEPDFTAFDAFLEGYNSVAIYPYKKNKDLYTWIMFAALSDTATFFCDRLSTFSKKKKIGSSYMYQKYLYFSNLS